MPFVLDASASVAWAFADDSYIASIPALTRVQSSFAIAPMLWHFETASVLQKALADARLTRHDVQIYLADLATLNIQFDPDPPDLNALLRLALRYGLSTYDASYLALALKTLLPLATLDGKLARAAQQAGVSLLLAT